MGRKIIKIKTFYVYHSYLLGDRIWKVLMAKNFTESFYEPAEQGYEIEL